MSSKLTKPIAIDDLLLYRLSRLLATGGASVIRLCEGQLGITRREWRVIASLKPNGKLLSSELADHAQLDRARTSRAISSLVAKGLIDRQVVPSDQRKATLRLTDKGRSMYEAFFPVVAELNQRLVQGLGDDTLTALDAALTHIQSEAEKLQKEAGQPKANRRRSGHRD
ncbi:MAG: MarR family winged helix-turn-helix transcriptional regulator [Burkholderiaceae bacterium]|nr:MarR family winged helix-turn-helix transcriptional regulator [Burkholderiaceae bacterium]